MNKLDCGCKFGKTIAGELLLYSCSAQHRAQAKELIEAEKKRLASLTNEELDRQTKDIKWPSLEEIRAWREAESFSDHQMLFQQPGRRFGKASEIEWRQAVSRHADLVIHHARAHLRSTMTPTGYSGDGRAHPSPEQARLIQQLWGDAGADIYVLVMALITVTTTPRG